MVIVRASLGILLAVALCSVTLGAALQEPLAVEPSWPEGLEIVPGKDGNFSVVQSGDDLLPAAVEKESPSIPTPVPEESLASSLDLPPVDAPAAAQTLPPVAEYPLTQDVLPRSDPQPLPSLPLVFDRSGWTGGAALLMLAPYQQGSEAYAVNSGQAFPSPTSTQTVESFGSTVQAAPLLWLGWQFDGESGIRTRFFWFNALSTLPTFSFDPDQPVPADGSLSPPPGLANLPGQQQFLSPGSSVLFVGGYTSTADFSSYLRIYSLDLEYTRERLGRRFESLFTAGGRYLNIDQTYTAFASAIGVDSFTGDTKYETQSLNSFRNFAGGGPTVSWLGRMRFGESRVKAYGGVRGSLLAGTFTERLNFVDDDFNVTTGILENTNGSVVDDVSFGALPVGELESGVEFDGAVGNRRWFTRLGVVVIDYFGLGAANGSTGDLVILGGEIAAGIRY